MTDHQVRRNEIDAYISALSDAEREAVDSASVALDIAGLAYRARIVRGFTQTEAAHASGLKQQSISRIEGGTINITVRMLERYLRALGFSLSLSIFDENTGEVLDQTTLNRPNNGASTRTVVSADHHNGALKR
jgi:transcriptional regulator with XRE-family HTH domain